MGLTGKQKKYLKRNLKKKSLNQIASRLGTTVDEIEKYLKKLWGQKKYQRFINQAKEGIIRTDLRKKILSFNFKTWLKKNRQILGLLTISVLIAYFNSLGNEFVSDDIAAILKNENLDQPKYIFLNLPAFLRPAIYFFVNKIFGRLPSAFRMINILFHLGTVLGVYFLTSLLTDSKTALFSAFLLAVHPLATEAVTWISGGPYSQYSFFLILAFLFYLLSFKQKKFYLFSLASFVLGLLTAEKAMVFPFILFAFIFSFLDLKKNWKDLAIPFALGGFWIFFYFKQIPQRITALQMQYYQEPQTLNPFFQIPIAITSYLELIFWPKNLTLYHSEMSFSQTEYLLRLTFCLIFLFIIVFAYKKNRQIFFWLSFFIISLLPTLTPFGISWIVAERYVYFGTIGIFVVAGLMIKKLSQLKKMGMVAYLFFALIIVTLCVRTILRNIDWKNQDNLWLAAAKTSPSSPQNHNNLGDYYGRHGNYEKAVEEFKKAIELNPRYADAYHNLANTYQQMEKKEEAMENYKKAIKFNPNLWQSYQNLAAIYFEQEKFDQALEYLETAVKLNPKDSPLYTNLGILYEKMNRLEEAKRALQTALILNPKNLKAKQLLMQIDR